jgi:hypothetical protein
MPTYTEAGLIRTLLKYIGFIPLSVFIHDVYFLLPGIVKYGRFPVYGKDPDASTLNKSYDAFFGIVGIIGGALSIIIIQFALLMTLYIIIRRVRISRIELLSLCSSFFILVWHIYFRFCLPASFAWVMD